jgi:hypothetical protein
MEKYQIPKKLGKVEQLIQRFDAAKARKMPWIPHLRECYEYALPQRETFSMQSKGTKKNTAIFDSTAVIGVQKYASRLQASLVPPWRNWTILTPGSEVPEQERDNVQKELDKVTDIVFDHINHSNFATQSHEAFLDLAVSTGAMTVKRSSGASSSILEFDAVPLAEVFPEEGPNSTIETVWREHSIPARHIDRLWPGATMSGKITKQLKEKPDAKVNLIEGTIFEPDSGMYYMCVIEREEKHVCFTEEYEVSPWIVFREMVVPGEVLGRGRVMQVLPDIKTANKVTEFGLRNAALAIAGIYTAQNDGVINPYTMQIAPGMVIPVGSNDSSNPTLRPLERAGDFNVGELVLSDLRDRINKALFADPYGGMDSPTKTATEMSLRQQELLMDAGSAFSRLQSEFIEKLIKVSVSILREAGKIPEIAVDGKEVTIKHTSPLARAQDQEDLLSMQQFMQMGAAFGPEAFALGAKIEDTVAWIGQKLGIDQKLLRTEQERIEMQEKAAEAMKQQQAQQEQQANG